MYVLKHLAHIITISCVLCHVCVVNVFPRRDYTTFLLVGFSRSPSQFYFSFQASFTQAADDQAHYCTNLPQHTSYTTHMYHTHTHTCTYVLEEAIIESFNLCGHLSHRLIDGQAINIKRSPYEYNCSVCHHI